MSGERLREIDIAFTQPTTISKDNVRLSGVQRAGRGVGDRVRNQVHGDISEGVHKRGGGLLHPGEGYQGQDGKETGETN